MIATNILSLSLAYRDAGFTRNAAIRLAWDNETACMTDADRATLADILGIAGIVL